MIGQVTSGPASRPRADQIDAILGEATRRYSDGAVDGLPRAWTECDLIVSHLALGATTRIIAPLLQSKQTDPGVVVIDDAGRFVVPLVGGHGGGANDLASLCWKMVTIIPHTRRKFVPRVDFITTPGYLSGPGAREAAGLPAGTGPFRVISTLSVMGFDPHSKRMTVLSIHPGVTRQDIVDSTSFEMLFAPDVTVTREPSDDELRILREQVDPTGMVLSKSMKE